MKLLLRKSIRDMRTNILLNISVFVIAFVGIFLFSGLNVTGISLKKSIDRFYIDHDLASYTITKELTSDKFSLLDKLNETGEITLDGAKQLDAVTLNIGGVSRNVEISLFTSNDFPVNTPELVEGHLPETSFEALIDVAFAHANGIKAGDKLDLTIEGEVYDTLICGLAIFPDHLYKGDAIPQIDETGIVKMFVDLDIQVDTLYVKTELSENDLIDRLILASGVDFGSAKVQGRNESISVMRVGSDIELITSLINILPWVCLASLCLILYVNASKRAEDEGYNVGVMTANGVGKVKIVVSLILPYLINVFVAGLLGSILGMIVLPKVYISLLSKFYTIPSVKFGGIFVAFVALIVLVAVTALALIIAMSSLFMRTPTSLMSGRHKGGSKALRSASAPIVLKLSLRNFISYKKKSLFTILSAALCLGLLVTSFMLDDSVSYLNRTVYGQYYNYDYTIGWNRGEVEYAQIKAEAEQSELFENIMFCFEYPAKHEGKNVLVSIMDDENPCYKIDVPEGGVCVPASYGERDSVTIELYLPSRYDSLGFPNEVTLPVSGTYDDIGMFGIIVPLSVLESGNMGLASLLSSGSLSTKIYLKRKEGANVDEFVQMLSEKYTVAFNSVEHSVDSNRFQNLFLVITVTEIILIVVCGIMMAVMVLNISSLSLSDRIRDYAVFKALGVGGDKVNMFSSLENVFSVLVAYVLSFPIGAAISQKIIKAVAAVTSVVAHLHMGIMSAAILFVCAAIFTVIGNILINKKIKKVNVASALKEE